MRLTLSKLRESFKNEKPTVVNAKLPTAGPPEGEINTQSDTWIFIEQWARHELQKCRETNDLHRDQKDTAALRGEIKRLKEVLSLPDPAKERHLVKHDQTPLRLQGYKIR